MENKYLSLLLCIFLSANCLGQIKENSQTKSKSSTIATQQKKPGSNVKKPKVIMPEKNLQKKSIDKTQTISVSQKNSTTPANNKTQVQKKAVASLQDSVHDNKPKREEDDSNKKIEKVIVPLSKDTAHPAGNSDIKEDSAASFNYLSLLPYLVIAILIGLLVRLNSGKEREIRHLKREIQQAKESNEYQVSNFKSQIKKLEGENKGLEDDLESVKKQLKTSINEKPKEISEDQVASIPIFHEPIPPVKEESPIRFARYADQGDGFASSELLLEEDNDTIFEIRLTSPKTATFKVANNLNAQKYALSNAGFFLGKTCKYDSTPSQNSIIATETEGELKLQGGKWLILNPAKIIFT